MNMCFYLSPYNENFMRKNDLFQKIPTARNLSKTEDRNLFYLQNIRGHLYDLYNIWKNNNHEYVGFSQDFHLLHISKNNYNYDVKIPFLDKNDYFHYGLTKNNISKFIKKYDIFLPKVYTLNNIYPISNSHNIITFYEKKVGNTKHIEKVIDYIKENYPEKYEITSRISHSNKLLSTNTIFTKKEIFDKYCNFLFDIILHTIKFFPEDENEKANFYIISLLIMTVFFDNSDNHYKILHNSSVFLDTSRPRFNAKNIISSIIKKEEIIKSASPKKILFGGTINIVMSFDDNYAGPARAVINSILAHTANQADIHIYIIYGPSLSQKVQNALLRSYKNKVTLIFKKLDDKHVNDLPVTISYISKSSYYRLFVQEILPDKVKRLLYIDTDIIVCDDIADLWNINLNGCIIGGVTDAESTKNRDYIFGAESKNNYINAGILIYDLETAKKKYNSLSEYFINVFSENVDKIKYMDQDIINISFQNDIEILPLRWNITAPHCYTSPLYINYNIDDQNLFSSMSEAKEAIENPAIFHFIGRRKPWVKKCLNPFKSLYWHYRMQDPNFRPTLSQLLTSWNYYILLHRGIFCIFIGGRTRIYQFHTIWKLFKASFLFWKR